MLDLQQVGQAARAVATQKKVKKVKKKSEQNAASSTSKPAEDNEEEAPEKKGKDSFRALGVCEELCQACDALGWTKPTPIQQETLEWSLKGRDIIGIAETGSGKTGAYISQKDAEIIPIVVVSILFS